MQLRIHKCLIQPETVSVARIPRWRVNSGIEGSKHIAPSGGFQGIHEFVFVALRILGLLAKAVQT